MSLDALTQAKVADSPSILLVDDEPQLLELLHEWFVLQGFQVSMATNGLDAVGLAKNQAPHVAITDMMMPGMSGLDVITCLRNLDPFLEVIVLSGQGTMENAIAALREGRAFDYVQKPVNLSNLSQVVERALVRRRERQLKASQGGTGTLPIPDHVEALTPREKEIMVWLAQGLENRPIADRLGVSEKTIKNHLTRIFEKLKVKNRTHALLTCQQHGLI